jgi:hypothetical protein
MAISKRINLIAYLFAFAAMAAGFFGGKALFKEHYDTWIEFHHRYLRTGAEQFPHLDSVLRHNRTGALVGIRGNQVIRLEKFHIYDRHGKRRLKSLPKGISTKEFERIKREIKARVGAVVVVAEAWDGSLYWNTLKPPPENVFAAGLVFAFLSFFVVYFCTRYSLKKLAVFDRPKSKASPTEKEGEGSKYNSTIMKLSIKMRIAIVISAIWIILCLVFGIEHRGGRRGISGYYDVSGFFIGIIPLAIAWGIAWILQGFKREKVRDSNDRVT